MSDNKASDGNIVGGGGKIPDVDEYIKSLGEYNNVEEKKYDSVDDLPEKIFEDHNTTKNKLVSAVKNSIGVSLVGSVFAFSMGIFGIMSEGALFISLVLLAYGIVSATLKVSTLWVTGEVERVENIQALYSNKDLHVRCLPCEIKENYRSVVAMVPTFSLFVPAVIAMFFVDDETMIFAAAMTIVLEAVLRWSVSLNLTDAENVRCTKIDRSMERIADNKRLVLRNATKLGWSKESQPNGE